MSDIKPFQVIVLFLVAWLVFHLCKKINFNKKKDGFEKLRNNYELYPYGVDINKNVLDVNAQSNNIQGSDLYDSEVIGFNNDINKYASFKLNETFEQPVIANKKCDMDLVKFNHMNEVDVINSFIQSQLTSSQKVQDNEDYNITNLRNNNVGKYSDVNTIINQNSLEYVSAPDLINAIRTSDGKEKFSSYGDTLWQAYDNLVKPQF
jgi:hypothetical protein